MKNAIAIELLKDCPTESLQDHQKIAEAIERGDSRETILGMSECDRWPETYAWLKVELPKDPAAVALGRKGGKAKSKSKAKSSAANGAKGGRPAWSHAVVVNYDCQLGERGKVVSRHSLYDMARAAAQKSGFDSFLAIRDRSDM